MSTVQTPRGLVPVKYLGANYFSGGFNKYLLPSNYTYAIANGDPVKMKTTGTGRGQPMRFNETTTATTTTASGVNFLGVCVGCEYTDPNTGQFTVRNHYPGAIVATDIYLHVVDDPNVMFLAQADGSIAQTKQGCNFGLIQTAVTNTLNGNSGVQLQASTFEETGTLPLRVVEFYSGPNSTIGDAYADVLVMFNPAAHFFGQSVGVDNS